MLSQLGLETYIFSQKLELQTGGVVFERSGQQGGRKFVMRDASEWELLQNLVFFVATLNVRTSLSMLYQLERFFCLPRIQKL